MVILAGVEGSQIGMMSFESTAVQSHPEIILHDGDERDVEVALKKLTVELPKVSNPFHDKGDEYERENLASVTSKGAGCISTSSPPQLDMSKSLSYGDKNHGGYEGKNCSKRSREDVDNTLLPSSLKNVSNLERRNGGCKQARVSANVGGHNPLTRVYAQAIEPHKHERIRKLLHEVNEVMRTMPLDRAKAFRQVFQELFKLVLALKTQPSHPIDRDLKQHPMPSEFQHGKLTSSTSNEALKDASYEILTPNHDVEFSYQNVNRRVSNSDLVLYKPNVKLLGSRRENISSSVGKQEVHTNQNGNGEVSLVPMQESLVGPHLTDRELILATLKTFEQCRQQFIRNFSLEQTQAKRLQGTTRVRQQERSDLKAATLMRERGYWLNVKKRVIGEIPGVTIGDVFRYRIEMVIIGLHKAVQAGIAIVPLKKSSYGVTIASSVVIAADDPYQDDKDMGDTIVYSGQGGLSGKSKESQDQELTRGNLALSNSYKHKLPIRVIRGHKEKRSRTGILYSYDGLYQIKEMKFEDGVHGKKVYKFIMQCLSQKALLV